MVVDDVGRGKVMASSIAVSRALQLQKSRRLAKVEKDIQTVCIVYGYAEQDVTKQVHSCSTLLEMKLKKFSPQQMPLQMKEGLRHSYIKLDTFFTVQKNLIIKSA